MKEAQQILHKTWNQIPDAKLNTVKDVCIQSLNHALNIGLDYIGKPEDALAFTKRIRKIQNEIQDF